MEHMNIDKTLQISSDSSEDTEKIGERIGNRLRGGEVIELISDLGGGKTTLVRGIARGFGSQDKVSSPTFTVNKEYRSGDKRIVHYDFYRLHDPGLMQFELAEALSEPDTVVIVEWADIVQDVLPQSRMTITITSTGTNGRLFKLKTSDSLAYLLGE
jgi:tRNA threonylcarbamoyladenosine biosynthesis protein TsaE